MGVRIVRPNFERFAQVGLGGAQPLLVVFGQPSHCNGHIDPPAPDERIDIVWIEIESPVELRPRSVEGLGGKAFVEERQPEEIVVHRIGI